MAAFCRRLSSTAVAPASSAADFKTILSEYPRWLRYRTLPDDTPHASWQEAQRSAGHTRLLTLAPAGMLTSCHMLAEVSSRS